MSFAARSRTLVIAAVLVLFAAASIASAAAADLVGTWTGDMDTQMGSTRVALTFKAGAVPAGTATLGDFAGTIEQGKMDGDTVSFVVTIEHGSIAFDGVVAGDEMKLAVTGTRGDKMSLVARRQK